MRRVVTAYVYKSAGMKLRTVAASLLLAWHSSYNPAYAADLGEPVPIYSEAELIKLIEENKHLERVKADNCQIVEDIVARATRISLPSYEFLYGDMLAWGVCVDQDVELGLYYMENAAHQVCLLLWAAWALLLTRHLSSTRQRTRDPLSA